MIDMLFRIYRKYKICIPKVISYNIFMYLKSIKWRYKNKHNFTTLNSNFNTSVVYVGNKSYGPLNVFTYGATQEHLFIGNYVSIAPNVYFILGGNHTYSTFSTYPFKVFMFGEKSEATTKGAIVIEDDVWIGIGVIILSGVRIGQGAVVAAGSIITKDVPKYAVVAGNPAKVIKYRFSDDLIKRLSKIDFSLINEQLLLKIKDELYKNISDDNQLVVDKILNEIGL